MLQLAYFDTDVAARITFHGRLVLHEIGDLPQRLRGVHRPIQTIDVGDVAQIDTVGAWLIHRLSVEHDAEIIGLNPQNEAMLTQIAQSDQPKAVSRVRLNPFAATLYDIGHASIAAGRTMIGLVGFLGAIVVAIGRIVASPSRFRSHAVVRQFEEVGVKSLGIIGLMSFLIGLVIAQQGAVQLRQFGAEILTINLIGRLTIRELGILMTAIMVAGRSGSAFAAQIGTMKLTEEIDALETIGIRPIEALVLPRVMASTLMMPLLGFYASFIAVMGGGIFCWLILGIPPITYVQRIREVVPITDLWVGLIKAPVFGLIIGMTGCFQGFLVESDAEQVGRKTTAAVVQAIFLVIVLDAFFAVFFTQIGWV